MVPLDLRPNLQALHAALGDGKTIAWQAAAQGDDPGSRSVWYGRILSSVLVLVGDSPIVYVSPFGKVTDDGVKVGALVFTESLAVSVDAEEPTGGEVAWTVAAQGMEGLREVGVVAARPPFDPNISAEWPGVVSATLTFESGTVLQLVPAGQNSEDRRALAEFVGKLTARLR